MIRAFGHDPKSSFVMIHASGENPTSSVMIHASGQNLALLTHILRAMNRTLGYELTASLTTGIFLTRFLTDSGLTIRILTRILTDIFSADILMDIFSADILTTGILAHILTVSWPKFLT